MKETKIGYYIVHIIFVGTIKKMNKFFFLNNEQILRKLKKNHFFIFYRLKTNKKYLQELHVKTGRIVEIKKI